MDKLNSFFEFILNVILTTTGHLIWLLGLIFIFGLLLYFLSRITRITYVKTAGEKLDIIVTGWIGTPVHEIGHAIFCILFRHKIIAIKLFNPDPSDGTLGYVNHSYNPSSRYQRIGNFFIGIGPVLFGAFVLYALLYFLMPEIQAGISQIDSKNFIIEQNINSASRLAMWETFKYSAGCILSLIFSVENLTNWKFWIFLYLSFSVASHMQLSPPDIKGAASGLLTLVITLLIFNLIILSVEAFGFHSVFGEFWKYIKLETYSFYINGFLGVLGSLFIYAFFISGINFVVSYILLNIYNGLIKKNGIINPFWI